MGEIEAARFVHPKVMLVNRGGALYARSAGQLQALDVPILAIRS